MIINFKKFFRRVSISVLIILSFSIPVYVSYSQQEEKYLEKGIWQYRHENYEEALLFLKKAREKMPASSIAAYYLGITYKQIQDYNSAKPHLIDAVTLKPRIKGALIELIDLLYRLDEIEEAKRWIEIAEKEGIRAAQIAFFKGLVLVKEGERLEEAISYFKKAKLLDTTLTRLANYQIGVSYLKLKSIGKAKTIFKEIVYQDPTGNIAAFANQYIRAIKRREEVMRPLKLQLSTFYQYDDNVILKPTSAVLATDVTDKGDSRQVYIFKSEYTFRPLEQLSTKFGYTFYHAKQNDLGFYDMVSNTFSVQPSILFKDVAMSFPGSYNHVVINDKNYLSQAEVGNITNIMIEKNQMLQGSFTYRNKDYLWEPTVDEENRDSNELIWGVSYYYFFANNKGFLNLRHNMNYDNTKGPNWRYYGNTTGATLLIPILDKIKLTFGGEFSLQNFLKRNTIYKSKRLDAIYLITTLLAIELYRGLELQAQYTYIRNTSNIGIYDYGRNVYSVGMQFEF